MDELECKKHVTFMHNLLFYMHNRLNDLEAKMHGEMQALRREVAKMYGEMQALRREVAKMHGEMQALRGEVDLLRHSLRVQQFSRDSSAFPAQLR